MRFRQGRDAMTQMDSNKSAEPLASELEAARAEIAELKRRVESYQGILATENRYRRKDGTLWDGRMHIRIVRDTQGKPSHFEGVVEDITERKRAEAALVESEQRGRHAQDAAEACPPTPPSSACSCQATRSTSSLTTVFWTTG